MKLNKSNIFALMTLGGLMAFGTIASAEDQAPATPPAPPADAPAGGRAGRGANMEKILDKLSLSDEQKGKIKPILKDMQEKLKAVRDDSSLSQPDKRPKLKEIRDGANEKLKVIMSADQFSQWEKLTAGGRRGRKNNPPPADAPATPPAAGDNK